MVKIARLINGDIICGDIVDTIGREQWNHLFFTRLVPQDNSKMGMQFIPVVQFGDFNQPIIIEDGQIVFLYDPNPEFITSYRHAIARYQAALNKAREKDKKKIIVPTAAEVIDITKR